MNKEGIQTAYDKLKRYFHKRRAIDNLDYLIFVSQFEWQHVSMEMEKAMLDLNEHKKTLEAVHDLKESLAVKAGKSKATEEDKKKYEDAIKQEQEIGKVKLQKEISLQEIKMKESQIRQALSDHKMRRDLLASYR